MKFTVVIEKVAQDHFKKIIKSGDIASLKKLNKILEELEIHPKLGTGKPEELKYNLSGFWSRRLNKKDRLIYEIFEEPENLVVVIAALGHY
jgi:toxin YoeB